MSPRRQLNLLIFLVLSPSELVDNSLVAAAANQATAQAK